MRRCGVKSAAGSRHIFSARPGSITVTVLHLRPYNSPSRFPPNPSTDLKNTTGTMSVQPQPQPPNLTRLRVTFPDENGVIQMQYLQFQPGMVSQSVFLYVPAMGIIENLWMVGHFEQHSSHPRLAYNTQIWHLFPRLCASSKLGRPYCRKWHRRLAYTGSPASRRMAPLLGCGWVGTVLKVIDFVISTTANLASEGIDAHMKRSEVNQPKLHRWGCRSCRWPDSRLCALNIFCCSC